MYSPYDIEKAKIKHELKIKERWEYIESDLTKKTDTKTAKDITDALKDLYGLVTSGEVVRWIAELYDPEIGGFYFSNSARDVDGYLPDLESTRQALGFFESSGMTAEFCGDMVAALPEWIGADIVAFVKKMQDRNGYFYHPQWSRAESDTYLARLGRDLEWAVWLLKKFGAKPTYDTPNGMKGEGGESPSHVCSVCDGKGGGISEDLVKEHLRDNESFMAYLKGFEDSGEIHSNSWKVGNLIESQATMIYDRDKVLRERGADYSLCDILAEWFERLQNPKNGAWSLGDSLDTMSTNGILKIASTFNRIKREFPRPLLAIESAITIAKSRKPIPSVCHALNPWYALSVIITNVRDFNTSDDKERVMKEVDGLRRYILENSADMIRAAREKLSVLKMSDGSFEMSANGKNGYSQGMPVSLPECHEGNVNAYICTRAVPAHIFNILGYENMPLFGEAERMLFVNILEEKHQKCKLNV